MKRNKLLKHLQQHGCELLREGGKNSIWWNSRTKVKSAVPRHRETKDLLVKKICKDLDIPQP